MVDVNKSKKPQTQVLTETFKVFPAQANDYFIIEYVLAENELANDVKILLFDTEGKEIMNFEVLQRANQLLAECAHLSEGIYWVRKYLRNKLTAQERIIIVRGDSKTQNAKKDFLMSGKVFEVFPNPANTHFTARYNISETETAKTIELTGP